MANYPVAKRIKIWGGIRTYEPGKSLVAHSKAILRLIGEYLTLQEFINLRSSSKFSYNANRRRWWRWKNYTINYRRGDLRHKCLDNYEFILSPFLLDVYHQEDPLNVPRSHYPSPRDCALASIKAIDPEVLVRIPLQVIHAFGGLGAISLLPSRPLLPDHFVQLTSTMQILDSKGRVAAGEVLSFTEENTAHPVELFYNNFCTALVLRLRMTPEDHGPIFVMWYTCTTVTHSGRPFWYCELQHEKGVKYFYKSFPPNTVVGGFVFSGPSAVQVSQKPQSPLSFLRPASDQCMHFVRDQGDPSDQGGFQNFNEQHSAPWDATDFLRTLILGRSVCSTSLTHKECFVRLVGTSPTGHQLVVSLLDWAHTQIQLPLTLVTSCQTRAHHFVEPVLGAHSASRQLSLPWSAVHVSLGHYQHLFDDEHFPLTAHDAEARMLCLMHTYEYSASDALRALFSKGSRGMDVRTATYIVCTLHNAVLALAELPDLVLDQEAMVSWIVKRLEPTKIGWPHFEENNSWWQPLLSAIIWMDHTLYDQSEEVEDYMYDDLGFHDPIYMCDICARRHKTSGPWRAPFTGSTHATRARLLRGVNFRVTPRHFNQNDVLCVADPDFSKHLDLFLDLALAKQEPIHFLLYVPAYHSANVKRTDCIAELAFKYNVRDAEFSELSAGRYYLHPVALLLDPRTGTCFVCDTHRETGD